MWYQHLWLLSTPSLDWQVDMVYSHIRHTYDTHTHTHTRSDGSTRILRSRHGDGNEWQPWMTMIVIADDTQYCCKRNWKKHEKKMPILTRPTKKEGITPPPKKKQAAFWRFFHVFFWKRNKTQLQHYSQQQRPREGRGGRGVCHVCVCVCVCVCLLL